MNYNELKKQLLSDPEVKAEYDVLEPEYQLIRDMISIMIIAREIE